MKKFILIRDYKPEASIGRLLDKEGSKELYKTLERPNLKNRKDDPSTIENESSCIPEGIYIVKKYSSKKYSDHWQICNVPNRSAILFHKANWVNELLGCIAIATNIIDMNPRNDPKISTDKKWMASQSDTAWQKFKKIMPKEFELEITSNDTLCKVLDSE